MSVCGIVLIRTSNSRSLSFVPLLHSKGNLIPVLNIAPNCIPCGCPSVIPVRVSTPSQQVVCVAMELKNFFKCDVKKNAPLLGYTYDIYQPVFLLIVMIFEWAFLLREFQQKNVQYLEVLELDKINVLRAWDVFKLG
ncbi:hypothetical protein MKW98_004304 [Papaver atlanticum]|uniref:Uncharacterized protein n=1 Tax=Papaver atlanticum TaxID=357466 RepID=A0AAD4T960_9MAGN|nr:hypothetical protein MKW98_004304 [Papaver atlanticum]